MNSPKIIRTPQEMKAWRLAHEGAPSPSIGFVPTMGALHEGHAQLLRRARQESDLVVLSIYVNKTQFNDAKDFEKYPQAWENDLSLAMREKVDVIFAPDFSDMYPDGYRYKVTENQLSHKLCGRYRPGHFDGVLSIVLKLFNIVRPTKAFFGEKDFQQLSLIRGMVESFFLDLEVIAVPTVRESDGLAMSSRNLRLNIEERALAPRLFETLNLKEAPAEISKRLEDLGFKVDYVEDDNHRRYAAAFLGSVRLIDNVEI